MLRLIAFDLDGTLADTLDDITAALAAALGAAGLPAPPRERVMRMVGQGAAELVARAASGAPDRARIVRDFVTRYEARPVVATRLYPGAGELLAAGGPSLAVVTNKPGRVARGILQALGVAERFVAVLGEDDVGRRKPDPEALRRAMAIAGAGPAETLMVGDSAIDVATARAAGVRVCAVTYGYGDPEALRAAGPDWWAGSLREVGEVIARG